MSADGKLTTIDNVLDLDSENRANARRMARVFVGNQAAHYVADFNNVTIDPKSGKHVPQYRDAPGAPTEADFLRHLQGKRGGNKGLLVIPVTQAGACRFGKIDVDVYYPDAKSRLKAARDYAQKIRRLGLPLVVELTKSGGVHLAHYSRITRSAADMRADLADWAAALNLPKKVEIFPKQSMLRDGDKGSGINLPYFSGDSDATVNYAVDAEGRRMSVEQWLTVIENLPTKPVHVPGAVDIEGIVSLIAPHWTDGQRDNLSLALGGALLRAGVEVGVVQQILDAAKSAGADGQRHRPAESIAKGLDSGTERIPGYSILAEMIGAGDAREVMRLAGGEPPKELLPFGFECVTDDWRAVAPEPLTYTIEPLLPSGVVGMLVAEGGAGKTTWGLRAAIAVATGRDLFGLPTKQGRVVYIAAEEHERALRRRYHWIVNREAERMRQEGLSPGAIDRFHSALTLNLTIRSVVGYEMYLIVMKGGQVTQGPVMGELLEKLPRPLELLVMDPISRLNGCEENSNGAGTQLINAGERFAREIGCTVLLCHHTGKGAAKDRQTDQYAARGASGFADAARSVIRLLAADKNAARDFTNVPAEVIDKGDLVAVHHAKSNEGPKATTFWLRRQALDFERFEPVMTAEGNIYHDRLRRLFDWWAGPNGGRRPFPKTFFRGDTEWRYAVFGKGFSRDAAQNFIDEALSPDRGDLVRAPADAKEKNAEEPGLVFREGWEEDSM